MINTQCSMGKGKRRAKCSMLGGRNGDLRNQKSQMNQRNQATRKMGVAEFQLRSEAPVTAWMHYRVCS